MTISASLEREIRQLNENFKWLRREKQNVLPERWGDLSEAQKIINLSKRWYDVQRNGTVRKGEKIEPTLKRGEDWKLINGRKVLFNLESIERLKIKLAK